MCVYCRPAMEKFLPWFFSYGPGLMKGRDQRWEAALGHDMDKSWMKLPRASATYIRGVYGFLNYAFSNGSQGNKVLCPCKKCNNFYWKSRDIVEET